MSKFRLIFGAVALLSACASRSQPPAILDIDTDQTAELPTEPLDDTTLDASSTTQSIGSIIAELSIEEAALRTLRANADLKVQQLSPEIAGTFVAREMARYFPELFAAGQYSHEKSSETARATGERFDVEGQSTSSVLGIRQATPIGGSVEATVSHRLNASDRTPDQHQVRAGLTLTQSLLRGFGPEASLASVRQAEFETQASTEVLRGYTQALLARCENAYWQFALASRQIEIHRQSLVISERQENQMRDGIELGARAPADLTIAEAELARREQALIDAEAALTQTRLELASVMGVTSEATANMAPISEVALRALPVEDLEERVTLARTWRPEIREAKWQLERRELEVVVTENGALPKLDAFLTLGKSGFASAFARSFSNVKDNTFDVSAGLSLSYLLGGQQAQAGSHRAHLQRQQATLALENLERLVDLDVRIAVNELNRAQRQIDATTKTRVAQERVVQAEQARLEAGASTTLAVAQAQRDLLATRLAEAQAATDYRRAVVGLYVAEGTLLARRGITTLSNASLIP